MLKDIIEYKNDIHKSHIGAKYSSEEAINSTEQDNSAPIEKAELLTEHKTRFCVFSAHKS